MTLVYRLLRKPFAANPFDGEGSYLFGGRWSHAGTRMAYTAEHLSLAMLEYMVHLDPGNPPSDLVLARAEVPETVSRIHVAPSELPRDWRSYPPPETLAGIGARFISEAKAAALAVPSALAPVEHNWLLNPAHPEFHQIKILATETFQYDPRLLR